MRRGIAVLVFLFALLWATPSYAQGGMQLPAVFLGSFLPAHPAGTDWFQSDIGVPQVVHRGQSEVACGWIMAQGADGDLASYVQVGWFSNDDGTFPFIEHRSGAADDWHRTIIWGDPLSVGQTIRVALSNDEGTDTWHYWLEEQGQWTLLDSSAALFGNERALFTRFVELHDADGIEPVVAADTFSHGGLVEMGAWRPIPDLTTRDSSS